MFRICVYKPTSSPIHLELKEGISASQAIREVSQKLGELGSREYTRDDLEGWKLRAKRVVEEGRWWSEKDIASYSDRKLYFTRTP